MRSAASAGLVLIVFHEAKLHRSGGACARRLGDLIRGGEAPTSAGGERRTRWPDLTIGPVPPAGGNGQPMTRAGAPFGASPRRFSLVLGPPSGNGRSRSLGLLDPAELSPCVHPLHQPVTDGPTKLGRAVTPRPPGARLTRPNSQASHPSLGRVGRRMGHYPEEHIKNGQDKSCGVSRAMRLK